MDRRAWTFLQEVPAPQGLIGVSVAFAALNGVICCGSPLASLPPRKSAVAVLDDGRAVLVPAGEMPPPGAEVLAIKFIVKG